MAATSESQAMMRPARPLFPAAATAAAAETADAAAPPSMPLKPTSIGRGLMPASAFGNAGPGGGPSAPPPPMPQPPMRPQQPGPSQPAPPRPPPPQPRPPVPLPQPGPGQRPPLPPQPPQPGQRPPLPPQNGQPAPPQAPVRPGGPGPTSPTLNGTPLSPSQRPVLPGRPPLPGQRPVLTPGQRPPPMPMPGQRPPLPGQPGAPFPGQTPVMMRPQYIAAPLRPGFTTVRQGIILRPPFALGRPMLGMPQIHIPGMPPMPGMQMMMQQPPPPVELPDAPDEIVKTAEELEQKRKKEAEHKKLEQSVPTVGAVKISVVEAPAPAPKEESDTKPKYDKDKAISDFKALLLDKGVKSSHDWKAAMGLIIFDKRYKALKSMKTRQKVFEEFTTTSVDREKNDRKSAKKRAKEDFLKMLEECEQIDHSTRFRDLSDLCGDDGRYQALDDRYAREDIFFEHISNLEEKEKEQRQERKEAFSNLLRKMEEITWDHRWKDAEPLLADKPEYQSCDRKDRMKAFTDYIQELKDAEKERKKKEEVELSDGFNAMLNELAQQLKIHAKSRWSEVVEVLDEEDPRFKAVIEMGISEHNHKYQSQYDREKREIERKLRDTERGSDSDSDNSDDERDREKRKKELKGRMKELEKEWDKERLHAGKEVGKNMFGKFLDQLDEELKEDRRALHYIMENLKLKVTSKDTVETLRTKCTEVLLTTLDASHVPLLFAETIAQAQEKEARDDKRGKKRSKRSYSRSRSRSSSSSRSRSRSRSSSHEAEAEKKQESDGEETHSKKRSRSNSEDSDRKRRKKKDKKKDRRKSKKRSKRARSESYSD